MASIQPSSPVPDRRLSLYYLPGGSGASWEIADSRGSLLLLYRSTQLYSQLSLCSTSPAAAGIRHYHLPALVVCDTVARRYTVIPCPQDLDGHQCLGLFLLDYSDRSVSTGFISFRVMAALHRRHACEPGRGVPVAYVFTPANDVTGAWNSVPASGWPCGGEWHVVKRAWSSESEIDIPSTIESFYFAGRGEGGSNFYWGIKGAAAGREALVLDEATAGFSTGMLPESMAGLSYELPVRVRTAIDAGNKDGIAVARASAERPGLPLLLSL